MKSEMQIAGYIQELRGALKKQESRRRSQARRTGANRSTLGIRRTRELEGKIAGLEWVLENDKEPQ